jgi:hypothetical protein
VDESYVLGPGDQLVLILTGDVELAHSLEVTREGFVVIPQVGQLHVANLTLSQLDALLATRLSRASATWGRARRRDALLRERVAPPPQPGVRRRRGDDAWQLSGLERGDRALGPLRRGGPSANGSMRRVEVRRGGRTVDAMDVYDYLLRGDASHDVRLKTGTSSSSPSTGRAFGWWARWRGRALTR